MKKYLFIFIAFLMSSAAKAQQDVCKVINGNGATVMVSISNIENNTIEVAIASDCEKAINVSFKFLDVRTNKKLARDFGNFGFTAQPNQTNVHKCKLPLESGEVITTVEGVVITNSPRCEKNEYNK